VLINRFNANRRRDIAPVGEMGMTANGNRQEGTKGGETKVWDGGVRLFHWLLVACVAVTIYTGFFGRKNQIDFHVIAGTAIAALVILRLIWGGLGSTYARFSSFVCSPLTALRHTRDLAAGRAHASMGHNPLGGWMIIVLLLVLIAICITGVISLGGVVKEGPLAYITTFATGREARFYHYYLALALAALSVLHILGALFESVRTRENLARAMVTGRKRVRPDAGTAAPRNAKPVAALVTAAVLAAIAVPGVIYLSSKPALGVPSAPMNPLWVKECGACHSAHHPTVAPAVTWKAIMAGLKDHFGENASLDPARTAQLTAYALANSSEKWDTRVANLMRRPAKDQPLRLTATERWKRIHGKLPQRFFKSKAVGGKLNCTNCHRDAETGIFSPRAIDIKHDEEH
jgi:cytochrome b